MIPVYGFLQGDSMGVLVFTYENDTIEEFIAKVQQSCSMRVALRENMQAVYKGKILNLKMTVGQVGIEELERIDVTENGDEGV